MFTAIRDKVIVIWFRLFLCCLMVYGIFAVFVSTWIRYLEIVNLACCFILEWFWLNCRAPSASLSLIYLTVFSNRKHAYFACCGHCAWRKRHHQPSPLLPRAAWFSAWTTARMQRKQIVRMRRSLESELKANTVRFERLARKAERNEKNDV